VELSNLGLGRVAILNEKEISDFVFETESISDFVVGQVSRNKWNSPTFGWLRVAIHNEIKIFDFVLETMKISDFVMKPTI